MKKLYFTLALSTLFVLTNCEKMEVEEFINFTLTFIRNNDSDSLFTMKYENGDDIEGENFIKYQKSFWNLKPNESATETFTIRKNRALIIKDLSSMKSVNTGFINDGDVLSWKQGSSSVIRGGNNTDKNNNNEDLEKCSQWVEENGACLSAKKSGGSSLPGVRKKWCKKDLGGGSFKYTIILEPINGGIDKNFAFYKRVRIVTPWKTFELTPSQFNSKGGFTSSHNSNVDTKSLSFYIQCVQ